MGRFLYGWLLLSLRPSVPAAVPGKDPENVQEEVHEIEVELQCREHGSLFQKFRISGVHRVICADLRRIIRRVAEKNGDADVADDRIERAEVEDQRQKSEHDEEDQSAEKERPDGIQLHLENEAHRRHSAEEQRRRAEGRDQNVEVKEREIDREGHAGQRRVDKEEYARHARGDLPDRRRHRNDADKLGDRHG